MLFNPTDIGLILRKVFTNFLGNREKVSFKKKSFFLVILSQLIIYLYIYRSEAKIVYDPDMTNAWVAWAPKSILDHLQLVLLPVSVV